MKDDSAQKVIENVCNIINSVSGNSFEEALTKIRAAVAGEMSQDEMLCETVVDAALGWNRVVSSERSTHMRIITAEHRLAEATDALMEHRS
jgi:hypothetical protein